MKKIGLWGSIASIIGLLITLTNADATSITQNVNGEKNNVVGENHGTININQSEVVKSTTKSYVLKNPTSGSVLVVSKPDLMAATDRNKRICMAIAGTAITLTGKKASQAGIDMWREIKIESGECSGKIGWTSIENITYE